MPDTGLLFDRLLQLAEIYMIQKVEIFFAVMLRRADWTPFFASYAFESRDHIGPIVASLDADFGCAIQRDRGTRDWDLKKICHVHVTSFLILWQAASFGGGFVAFRYLL